MKDKINECYMMHGANTLKLESAFKEEGKEGCEQNRRIGLGCGSGVKCLPSTHEVWV